MAEKKLAPRAVDPDSRVAKRRKLGREILASCGINAKPVTRYRVRSILTPFEQREDILLKAQAKGEAAIERAMKRELTRLDCALTNGEAQALERICNACIGVANIGSIDYGAQPGASTPWDKLPFSQARERELRLRALFVQSLRAEDQFALYRVARALDPMCEDECLVLNEAIIAVIKVLAQSALSFYQEYEPKIQRKTISRNGRY